MVAELNAMHRDLDDVGLVEMAAEIRMFGEVMASQSQPKPYVICKPSSPCWFHRNDWNLKKDKP